MNTEKQLYAVTRGTYSDYRVCAIFDTKKLAQEYIDAYENVDDSSWNHFNSIEEYPLNPTDAAEMREGYKSYRVLMLRNGDVEEVEIYATPEYYGKGTYHNIWRRSKVRKYKENPEVEDCLIVVAWVKTKEHAIKIASECRRELIATGKW